MSAALCIELDTAALPRVSADLICVGVFEGEQPPRGEAGRADWRLCGLLSELIAAGRLRGARGEAVLVPSFGRLRAPRVLAVGMGPRSALDARRAREAARDGVEHALDLGAGRVVWGAPGDQPLEPWLAPLLEAAAAAVAERRAALRVALRVEPEARAALARSLHEAATSPALRGASLELPPIVERAAATGRRGSEPARVPPGTPLV